ncbi:Fic family protein [Pontivivens nitratireducens]|uniref:Fic family protein n=1 Tax=Pontivivens nitratireducens TaxID=2758038 RepID=A0A6G7VR92_9RHOB|nr:DUF4172 domain-containing protein [Pontibrevibacter nitratireducens]QIK42559.1 Fic family protein [Pontibrevibacter nitratireducens]
MHIWNSPAWPHFRHDPAKTERPLARVMARLGSIDGLHAGLSAAERQEIFLRAVTGEALASFAIEGVRLPAPEIEASVIASLTHRQTVPQRRSDAIAELMLDARTPGARAPDTRVPEASPADSQAPFDIPTLHRWHALLFHGMEVEDPGRWRSFPIDIVRGPSGQPRDVLYSAPPPERVPQEMQRFLGWLARDTHPLPVRAALAHLWFESIHPFADGNGRIGRAIVERIFATEGALPFSLSRQIEADKRGYYAALQTGRRDAGAYIDATGFVLWFLDRLDAGITEAAAQARFLVRRNAYLTAHADLPPRPLAVLRRLFDQGQIRVEQGLSAGPYAKMAKVSAATATRDLTMMESAGALLRSTSGGRSTRYLLTW